MWICPTMSDNPSCTPCGGRDSFRSRNPLAEMKGKTSIYSSDTADRKISIRLSGGLYNELESEMAGLGFRKMSQYLRMIIERRRRKDNESIDCSRSMMTSMGHLANEIRKIGRNYNQFVAAYNRAVKLTGKDGYPVVSERETRRNQLALMELTLEMTQALHAIMDHMGREHGEIQIVKQQPKEKTEEKKSHHRGELIIP